MWSSKESALVPWSSSAPTKNPDRDILHSSSYGPSAPGSDGAEVILVTWILHVRLHQPNWSPCCCILSTNFIRSSIMYTSNRNLFWETINCADWVPHETGGHLQHIVGHGGGHQDHLGLLVQDELLDVVGPEDLAAGEMPEHIVDLVLEPAAQHLVNLVHGDSSATEILSEATTSSMGLNLMSNSLTMDLVVLIILMSKPNHWDMLSLNKECVINGDIVAQSISCLQKLFLCIHQLLSQVRSHHNHVHPCLTHQPPIDMSGN